MFDRTHIPVLVALFSLSLGNTAVAEAPDCGEAGASQPTATMAIDAALRVTGFTEFMVRDSLGKRASAELVNMPDTLWPMENRKGRSTELWRVTLDNVAVRFADRDEPFNPRDFTVYLSKDCDTLYLIESVKSDSDCIRPTGLERAVSLSMSAYAYSDYAPIPDETTFMDAISLPRALIQFAPSFEVRCVMLKDLDKPLRPVWAVHGFCVSSITLPDDTRGSIFFHIDAETGDWMVYGNM